MLGVKLCSSEKKIIAIENEIVHGDVDKKSTTPTESLGEKSSSKTQQVNATARNKSKSAKNKKYKSRPNKIKLKNIKVAPCHSYD
jgi:hypothetical protein